MQLEKRKRVLDLLSAQVSLPKICETAGVSRATVFQVQKSRLACRKKILSWMKKQRSTVRIFSNEKLWTVDQSRNARNDRFIRFSPSEVHRIHTTKHPASAIILGVVGSDGKQIPPYWFPQGLNLCRMSTLKFRKLL